MLSSKTILEFLLLLGAFTVVDASLEEPPSRTGCTSPVGEIYNCEDGGWCKPNLTQTSWECFNAAGVPVNATTEDAHDHDHEEEAAGGTCVVHGGHTHGDCSGMCTGLDTGDYNKGLHIGAIFIMLVSSAIGVFAPILFHNGSISRLRGVFFAVKHFGTGVIICTALIHLLYHSFIMFNNACVSERLAYDATAPALALAALFLTFIIDYTVHRYIRRTSVKQPAVEPMKGQVMMLAPHKHFECSPVISRDGNDVQSTSSIQSNIVTSRQDVVNVQLLEAEDSSPLNDSSIMIGVSLGATGGSEWIPLLCAIVFHQMFEGLGLGSRIAELSFPAHAGWRKWVMGFLFAVITPAGVAIGVGVHESYNPNSVSALVAIGVLNALSAGILLYTGIVEMLVNDFVHGELKDANLVRAVSAIVFILMGALGMAVIGKWA
ncbi:hypothetical protein V5O48_006757 [Marasmius crinis-equi]|uniref:Uncharacterized protein n=1 Tax=Marasmius crinis-equi TaxID=585013 RepID=A0ABR3FIV4_9AGAR